MWSQNCDDCGPERLVLWVATPTEQRADRIASLAKQINLPRAALAGNADLHIVPDRSPNPEVSLNKGRITNELSEIIEEQGK
jgi:hypothetical protein